MDYIWVIATGILYISTLTLHRSPGWIPAWVVASLRASVRTARRRRRRTRRRNCGCGWMQALFLAGEAEEKEIKFKCDKESKGTRWCPSSLAKLVNITPMTFGFMMNISWIGVINIYKPTYNWGVTTLYPQKNRTVYPEWNGNKSLLYFVGMTIL